MVLKDMKDKFKRPAEELNLVQQVSRTAMLSGTLAGQRANQYPDLESNQVAIFVEAMHRPARAQHPMGGGEHGGTLRLRALRYTRTLV